MSDIRVIAAGAGTGKTHRLAQELVDALVDPNVAVADRIEPEGVVAVTYTRAAAAELEARVRQALVEEGHVTLAQRLVLARIGTVHSVCARLVEENAFSLGMPPEIGTIDERAAAALFDDALQSVITDDERVMLDALEQRCRGVPFEVLCRTVVDRARANDLDKAALEKSRINSKQALLLNLPPPGDGAAIERDLRTALDEALTRFSLSPHSAAQARDEHARLSRARDLLVRGEPVSWSDWLGLEEGRVRNQAMAHTAHPQLGQDLLQLIDLVFSTSLRAMDRFAEEKRQQGVVDFIDQEKLALSLLNDEIDPHALGGARGRIAQSVQLLLVDEFQDTSPLQMALFHSLSQVARRTVVVGDAKQTIFGFRDASPELFEQFTLNASRTDRLSVSHRSRKGLVDAVSAVFGKAFAKNGLDEKDVVLTAKGGVGSGDDDDDTLLGVHVERWWEEPQGNELGSAADRRGEEDLASAGVAEILSSRDVPVRASPSPGVRPAQAKDIAILCRTNAACRQMAQALAKRGVPVLLRSRGLGETFEARVVAAALALWQDSRDSLAAAALVRMLADVEDELLPVVIAAERGKAFADHPLVTAVVEAAVADRKAGVVAAFDRVVEVLRLRDELPRFGDAAQRLADLAALRALCVRFVDEAVARGQGPTVAGLVARLEQLRGLREDDDDKDDERGDVAGKDAVSVLTWHKSKGREWPIVVLTGLWRGGWVNPFDTAIETEVALPSLDRPLFGRSLRLWPSPYGSGAKGSLYRHLMASSPQVQKLKHNASKEDLRLLYVGFTRAKDRIVVVGDSAIWGKGMMETLAPDKRALCCDPRGAIGVANWAGADVLVEVRAPARLATTKMTTTELALPLAKTTTTTKTARAPMFVQPSAQEGTGVAGWRRRLGAAITTDAPIKDELVDLNHVGQCVHAFLAVDAFAAADDDAGRFATAARLRKSFQVEHLLSTAKVIEMGRRLWRSLDELPGHVRRTEVPLLQRLPDGSVVRGFIDLLVEHDGAFIVVDHKNTFDSDVAGYAGQLRAYASAVGEASGKPVKGTWIHLPLLGEVVEVVLGGADAE